MENEELCFPGHVARDRAKREQPTANGQDRTGRVLKAYRITSDNIDSIQGIYADFSAVAKSHYSWNHDAIEFDVLKKAFKTGMLGGYWVEDTGLQSNTAFMLFTREEHRSIEINLIHLVQPANGEEPNQKALLDTLMRAFIKDLQNDENGLKAFDVISYAMLGVQAKLIRSILWYGFKASGQAIVRFDIMDPVSLAIMKKQEFALLPEGYRLVTWAPQYAGGVAKVLYGSFAKSTDSYWDPRFRSELGCRKLMANISYGIMGDLCEQGTSILLKGEEPVGVCLLIQSTMTEGNIPLVGVLPDEKKKDFGNILLQHTLSNAVQGILDGKFGMLSINATHDTDNIAAIKMYRRMGFREEENYPHVYLSNEKLRTIQLGKWC